MDEHLREKRLSGGRAFDGRLIKVDVDRVRFADGSEAIREVVRHPGAIVIAAVFDDGRVLLERQFRYAANEVLWELPAGRMDEGEDPLSCAQRELAEETAHRAGSWRKLATFFAVPGYSDEVMHCFLATDLTAAAGRDLDDDERIDIVTMPLEDALKMAERGEIRDAKTLIGLFLAERALMNR